MQLQAPTTPPQPAPVQPAPAKNEPTRRPLDIPYFESQPVSIGAPADASGLVAGPLADLRVRHDRASVRDMISRPSMFNRHIELVGIAEPRASLRLDDPVAGFDDAVRIGAELLRDGAAGRTVPTPGSMDEKAARLIGAGTIPSPLAVSGAADGYAIVRGEDEHLWLQPYHAVDRTEPDGFFGTIRYDDIALTRPVVSEHVTRSDQRVLGIVDRFGQAAHRLTDLRTDEPVTRETHRTPPRD